MFCKSCGTQLSNEAVFCHKCARPTNDSHQSRTPQPQVVLHPAAKTVIVRKSSGFGVAFFTVLLLFCGIGGLSLYQKYRQETIIDIPGIGKITKDKDNFYLYGDTASKGRPSQQIQSSSTQTSSGGGQVSGTQTCVVSNNGNNVNIRTNCDTQDCYSDDTTIGGTFADGTQIRVLDYDTIESGNSFVWVPIEISNGIGWIASSKLYCSNN